MHYEGGDADMAVDAIAEGAEARAALGLATLGHSVAITQRLDEALLKRVLDFDARDRTSAFTKELRGAPAMQREASCDDPAATTRRADLAATLQPYAEGLRAAAEGLSAIADVQRRHFQHKEGRDVEAESADEDEPLAPPHPQQPRQFEPEPEPPHAFFAPCVHWRRPSDL